MYSLLAILFEKFQLDVEELYSHPHCQAQKRIAETGQLSMSRDGSLFVYNPDVLREQFAGLVIQRGLPFNYFDDEQTTRVFQKHLQPKYNHIFFMTTKLSEYELEGGILSTMVQPMKEKLKKYFERFPPIITCAAALNPCFNVQGVEFLNVSISTDLDFFDDTYATKAKKWFTDSFEGLYNIYYIKFGNPTTTESSSGAGGSSSWAGHGNQVTSLLRRLKEHKNKKARSNPSLSSEYERYVHSDFVTHLQTTKFKTFDVLGFWKAKETTFPVLSRMAMDILSVQAISVASEFAFSTSGRVLSMRRTRLTLASLEMSNEAIPLSEEEIALEAASSEGSMSGPGSRGEEAEAEANYGYNVYHDDY
nr:zinc finger BED domain-containing protein RICESLEEPER 2-like [Tanacetum cinerariifolium]